MDRKILSLILIFLGITFITLYLFGIILPWLISNNILPISLILFIIFIIISALSVFLYLIVNKIKIGFSHGKRRTNKRTNRSNK